MADATPHIDEIPLPTSIDDVRGADYEAVVDIHNAIILEYPGALVKLGNIRLQQFSPEMPAILTDNAEENRPMLDVNEAIGFVPISWTVAWQKSLD